MEEFFLSTNNGANWEPVNNGITNWKIQSFAVKDTCLFVGTQSDGVFYSTNYGKNWTAKNAGLLNKDIRDAIVIDDVVLVITNGWGVHRSTDNGDNWSYVDINPRPYYVSSFYKKGDTLYFGAMDCLFSSVNKGISWEYLTMAFGNSHTFVVTDSCVITGSEWGVWSGVYSQGDYSWKSLTNYITDDYIKSVFISDDIIYAGKFRSDDNGANFKEIKEFGEVASYLADGSNIFAGLSNSGVQISTDYGVNWEEINNGLTRTDITCLEMMGQDIFAGTFGGVFRSTNNGGSWTGVNTGLSGIKITSLASTSTAIFAGTIGGGINISTNNGMNWATSNSGLTNANINDFVVNELNIYAGTDNGLFFSQNNGVSWQKINSQLFTDTKINTLFTFNSRIYAGVKNGLYMSSDFGDAWYKIDTGLPNTSVLSIGIKGGYIYVGTLDNGLWKCLLSEIIVSVNEESINQANNFRLSQNYPNPFNPSTTISFSLPKKEFVTLKIYDVLGKEITTLVNEELNAGSYKNDWNAGNLASGIYFYRLQAGKYNETRKIMLLK